MSRSDRKFSNVQRRAVLKGLLIGGASILPFAGHALRAPLASDPRRDDEHPEPEGRSSDRAPQQSARLSDSLPPWGLVAPLGVGTYVGSGWRVKALSRVKQGAAILTLRRLSGEQAEIHLCRRSGLPRGLANTAHLDLYLMNDGDGDLPTPEGVGRAVKTVALRIARRERAALARVSPPHAMMSHWTRVRWYGPPEGAA